MSTLHQDYEFEVDTIDDLNHECDDDCRSCSRDDCPDLNCRHAAYEGECLRPGCPCARFLEADMCEACDGHGEVWFDVDTISGAVREKSITCRTCYGTGAA